MVNKQSKKDFNGKVFVKSTISVVSITLLGILLRFLPSYKYPIWGVDFGIYYNLTTKFLVTNEIFPNFPSIWGSSGYGFFPVFYWMMGIVYKLTGLGVQYLLLYSTPIFAGLTIPILYFIAKKITGVNEIAIISALIYAINPMEVFETSMVGLLIFGHLFLLLSILFYLYTEKNTRYYIPLAISSMALILSHHLSTYMYIISLIGIIFLRKIFDKNYNNFKYDFIYLLSFSGTTFFYWLAFVPSMSGFFSSAFEGFLPWYLIIVLYFSLVILLLSYAKKFRRFILLLKNIFSNNLKNRYLYFPFFIISFVIFIMLSTTGINGVKISNLGIILALPYIILFSFVGIGLKYVSNNSSKKIFLFGWVSFLILSLIYSTITWNGILIPYRYLEYLFEPLSIISATGIYYTYKHLPSIQVKDQSIQYIPLRSEFNVFTMFYGFENRLVSSIPLISSLSVTYLPVRKSRHKNVKRFFAILLGFSIIFSIGTIYPLAEQVSGTSQNYVTPVMMTGILWLEKYGNKNYSVATDAVDGLYLEAQGFNTTFEYTYKLWNSTNWYDAIYELEGLNGTYPKVGYVLINSNMYDNGVYGYELSTHPSYDPPVIISNSSFAKFFNEPFVEVYYNSSEDGSQWVYVFQVNWMYIENYSATNQGN